MRSNAELNHCFHLRYTKQYSSHSQKFVDFEFLKGQGIIIQHGVTLKNKYKIKILFKIKINKEKRNMRNGLMIGMINSGQIC